MAYRLPSERVTLAIEDGPTVEVEKIGAQLIYSAAVGLASAVLADTTAMPAVRSLYAFFVDEAQPSWQIVDHKGTVPATASGMYRLPLPIALDIVLEWISTFVGKPTAVDEMIPAGPLRDALNEGLRKGRKSDG